MDFWPCTEEPFFYSLTPKWSRYSVLSIVVKEGSLWTLTQKSTFPNEFGSEMRATDKIIKTKKKKKKKIQQKKKKKKKKTRKSDIQLQNGGQKTHFHLAT